MWSLVLVLFGILWFAATMIGFFDLDESDERRAMVQGYYVFYVVWLMLGKHTGRYRLFMFVIATALIVTGLGGMAGL